MRNINRFNTWWR